MNAMERVFRARFTPGRADRCWLWAGSRDRDGYGRFVYARQGTYPTMLAHRAAWIVARGPIPPGAAVCHTCDVRLCVNPSHLWLGTNRENQLDKVRKGRQAVGRHHGRAKLTPADVRQIRLRLAAGESIGTLGGAYGVSPSAIWFIKRGEHWRSV